MAIEFNGFNNSNKFLDYQRADQEFQLKKQAAQIDNQAKQLSLVGQIVGNNSVDQASYDRARQVAAGQGLDIGALPDQYNPDVVNRLRFAGATPTAQLSALISSQGHQLKAGIAQGDVGAYGYGSTGAIIGNTNSQVAPAISSTGRTSMSQNDQNSAIKELYSDNPTDQQSVPVINVMPNITADTPTQITKFSFRAQKPGETVDAYKTAQQQAFEGYKSDPNYIAAQKKAEKAGEFAATNEEGANVQNETLQRLDQNLNALKDLNNNLPEYGGILPVSVKARGGLIAGDYGDKGKGYDALQKWDEINQQQVVNAIGDLVKGGQIRGNQFIEKIINRGYAIDPNAQKTTRADQIEILRNELKNAAAQGKNIAGGNQPYTATLPSQANSYKAGEADFNARKVASPEDIAAFKKKYGIK